MHERRAALLAAQKTHKLPRALFLFERADAGERPSPLLLLFDEELPVGKRRDLRKVRNGDDLRGLRDVCKFFRYDARRLAADTRIDLIKDVCSDGSDRRELRLDRQHEAAHLAAADDLAELFDGLARIGGKEEFDAVQTLRMGGRTGY